MRRDVVLEKGLLSMEFVDVGPLEFRSFLAGVAHDEERKAVTGEAVGLAFDHPGPEITRPLDLSLNEMNFSAFGKSTQNVFDVAKHVLMLLFENFGDVQRENGGNAVNYIDDRHVCAFIDSRHSSLQ